MTPEEQRVAIPEACGWRETEAWLDGRRCFERADSNAGWDFDSLPNYLNDLNAMHEAEKCLPNDIAEAQYALELLKMVSRWAKPGFDWGDQSQHDFFLVANATARQRAEAFLRVKGLWKEEA